MRCTWFGLSLSILLPLLISCGGGGGIVAVSAPVASAPVVNPAPPVPAPTGWNLVWSDEFTTAGLPDSAKWGYDTSRNSLGWYNNELQYYTNNRLETPG